MPGKLERRVRERARNSCEYCLLPQEAYRFTFPLDHIIAKQHRGKTVFANLAVACLRCNSRKGPNLAGIDPVTGEMVRLFHPRRDDWHDHFRWKGPRIQGRTAIGRTTIAVLDMNHSDSLAVRAQLIAEGGFPHLLIIGDESV
jgi:hypothetical protein